MSYAVEPEFANESRIAQKRFRARILKLAINRPLQSFLRTLRNESEMQTMIKELAAKHPVPARHDG